MGARPELVKAPEHWLTPVELDRAARFRFPADRQAFVAAHLLVRLCAAVVLETGAHRLTLLQHCDVHGPGHGRPYLKEAPDLGVSLSHTRGYVCAAAGPGRVGIDAERVPEGAFEAELAARIGAPAEVRDNRALIRLWTRKEALVKRGELTLDTLADEPELSGRHVLEWWEMPDMAVAVVSDEPTERVAI